MTFAVSFRGVQHIKPITSVLLAPQRTQAMNGTEPKLGITEECDFNTNDWHSPRYDFDGVSANTLITVCGDYPFQPSYLKSIGKKLASICFGKLTHGSNIAHDNYWRAQRGSWKKKVWKQLTNPYNNIKSGKKMERGYNPIRYYQKLQNLTQDDLKSTNSLPLQRI